MPIICSFDGLEIKMYFMKSEHNPPHIHVYYKGEAAVVDIQSQKILDGKLPKNMYKKLKLWMVSNKDELMKMWISDSIHYIPPMK